jgi:subtilisin family serine protease
MKLRFSSFAWLALLVCAPLAGAEKIDEAIDLTKPGPFPVFVRMSDQVIGGAGEYETLCRDRSRKPRSQNRKEVLSQLRSKADKSWEKIGKTADTLLEKGEVRAVRRFWIVNGFSCLAKPTAIRKLAKRADVSYVYLDRFARPLKKPLPMSGNQMTAMKEVLATWKKKEPEPILSMRIPWNVREIGAELAWKEENATGRGVTVAVIDSGILPTPSLIRALVKNPKEELNGKDDDGNGLIDDVFGYDFMSNTGYVLETGRTMSHGSCCAGIIAGRSSAKGWQTAIAPDSRLLLIKGGFDLRSMEYLLLNGADLVSMSYMIVGRDLGQIRGLFRNAFEHMSLGGVLAVGGAGNYGPKSRRAMPAGKQIGLPKDIPSVLAVAGVDQKRVPLPFSSEGPCFWEGVQFFSDYPKDKPLGKPDLTAFPTGYPVWNVTGSHRLRPDWKEVSKDQGASLVVGPAGNSFSGPHCAGVAALVFSANPAINSWEVSEILQETAKDLGPKGRDNVYGAGLIDALAAVRAAKKKKD